MDLERQLDPADQLRQLGLEDQLRQCLPLDLEDQLLQSHQPGQALPVGLADLEDQLDPASQ